jgi:hypothetical protein
MKRHLLGASRYSSRWRLALHSGLDLTDLAQPSGMPRNPTRSKLGWNIFAAALVLGTMVLVMLAKYRCHLL